MEQFTAFFAKSKTHHAAAAHLCLGWAKCDNGKSGEVDGIRQLQVLTKKIEKGNFEDKVTTGDGMPCFCFCLCLIFTMFDNIH